MPDKSHANNLIELGYEFVFENMKNTSIENAFLYQY